MVYKRFCFAAKEGEYGFCPVPQTYSMSATGGIALAEKDKNSSKTNHGP